MKIVVANDHAAVNMKKEIMSFVEDLGHEAFNVGTDSEESCDYPVYAEKAARAVVDGEADCGI